MQNLIVIEGPTASGKTALAVDLAKRLQTVVISADSRQFYKELAIGTAKPDPEELQGVPHYFIDSHSIHEPLTAGVFAEEAMQLIQQELKHFRNIIVVGGSGMFIDALCKGLDPIPVDETIQLQLREEFENHGIESLLVELKEKDPDFYREVDQSNPARIIRALEVVRLTGKPFSSWRKNNPDSRPFNVQRFVLDWPREILYQRINQRVDLMLENGLLDEARRVFPFRELSTLQTVGYKELFDYFDGNCTLEFAIDKIKQHTRNYAKRQLTWFRRNEDAYWLNPSEQTDLVQAVLNIVENQQFVGLE